MCRSQWQCKHTIIQTELEWDLYWDREWDKSYAKVWVQVQFKLQCVETSSLLSCKPICPGPGKCTVQVLSKSAIRSSTFQSNFSITSMVTVSVYFNYIVHTKRKRKSEESVDLWNLEFHFHSRKINVFSRWVRLLFGREFPMQDLLVLWDAIFADGIAFDLVDYMFVAMLLYIRDLCKLCLQKIYLFTEQFHIISQQ